MSIRPPTPEDKKQKIEPNGNPAVHPTRNNPHPQPHDFPNASYHLFIVDGLHHIYEFDVLSGKLTEWSRRNPASSLPPEFSSLKDRVMGCIWDISASRQRVWLYGSSWLFMFNLAKDLKDNIENQAVAPTYDSDSDADQEAKLKGLAQNLKKERRKHFLDVAEWQKDSTGAGDRIRDDEVIGLPRKMRKITRDADGRVVEQIIEAKQVQSKWREEQQRKRKADAMEDGEGYDEDKDKDMKDLPPLQRDDSPEADAGVKTNGIAGALVKYDEEKQTENEKLWWSTHKYRPILGVVPLERKQDGEKKADSAHEDEADDIPEVVLVERPLWDVELPPKFMGAWDKRD